ncbi:MAG: segregation/condensation protein A [Bauldia sp.]|nr:segregation/condensation protein A [Bauldia sp.]
MTGAASPDLWDAPPPEAPSETLVVDVDGFEGPLDLLLDLARTQKVDLARISVLALAEQYLAFVERSRLQRLELAGDYLVMAAWLAYLKSRLLLPEPAPEEGPSGEELAAALAFRLQRLQAMRAAAAKLMERDRLGRTVFGRGAPETRIERRSAWQATLYDLLSAYAAQRRQKVGVAYQPKRRVVWSLVDARAILQRMIGRIADWTPLEVFLSPYLAVADTRRTALASSFGASLELAKEGRIELRQTMAFGPLYLRSETGRSARG